MKATPSEFKTSDGTKIHFERWIPDGAPTFVVMILHGGAEHVSRYEELAARFVSKGALVFGPDHRGQGRSGGAKGHVESFTQYAHDVHELAREIARMHPEAAPDKVPWFLFGHSMGGLISLTYLLEHAPRGGKEIPLRGAMISAPLLGLVMKVNPVKRGVAKLLDKAAPKMAVPAGIPPEYISRDADEVRKYVQDDRRVGVVSARWASAMEAAMERVHQEVHRLELPMLWYVGTGDKICDHRATLETFGHLHAPEAHDQSLEVFDGYYHELHNEPPELRAPILKMLEGWVDDRREATRAD